MNATLTTINAVQASNVKDVSITNQLFDWKHTTLCLCMHMDRYHPTLCDQALNVLLKKDGVGTFYQNALWSEIVEKSKVTSFEKSDRRH